MVSANSLAMWKKPRPPTQQQCLVCGKSGHCVESCSDVTGVAIERGRADRMREQIDFGELMGRRGVPRELRSREDDKVLERMRVSAAGEPLHLGHLYQMLGFSSGCPFPMAAPKSDLRLRNEPALARFFEPHGAARHRKKRTSSVNLERGNKLTFLDDEVRMQRRRSRRSENSVSLCSCG